MGSPVDTKDTVTTEAPTPETTTAPALSEKTTTAKAGCDVGSAAFDNGCCASTLLLDCNGTKYCTSACPAAKTATVTTTPKKAAATTTTESSAPPSSTLISSTSSSPSSAAATTTLPTTSSTLSTSTITSEVKHTSTSGNAIWTWTGVASNTIQLTSAPTPTKAASTHSGLSAGVEAGIGVGSAVIFLLLVSMSIILCVARRRKKRGEKKIVEVGVGSDWRRGGYAPRYAAALPALARSASRKIKGYQAELHDNWYGHRNNNQGPAGPAGRYDEMPAVELSSKHDLEQKQRLAAIRESLYG
ncbi:hypothetical protein L207DRAFT_642221 [Hyaloscypha variabilis F]|uniref:Uncharacterized protein n=1 Tax=Hyaloscypha variabilis (strain UAMH 11265 / GT02V1 / F) TaxID=1149755 RepID=A0A2J6QTT1_HYAVF|nr:hypothetical protein L207DRAFT_642221 [Hyaloscypha variabilis F]